MRETPAIQRFVAAGDAGRSAARLVAINQKMEEPDYIRAHKHSSNHREELMRSDVCGCFYCLEIYSPVEITDWIDEDENGMGKCALCAKCGIDSVIGSASGYPVTKEFLREMHLHWF